MARPRKDGNTNIEEQITKQEDAVAKAKAKYDGEVAKLKDLYAKKDEIKKKELLKAVENSEKSYEEIMAFLGGQTK
ncbi:MAG: ErpK protein [Lachnospiraceae bacterium]|nr:ErpK protein [Lachnospiraceae bacterium]